MWIAGCFIYAIYDYFFFCVQLKPTAFLSHAHDETTWHSLHSTPLASVCIRRNGKLFIFVIVHVTTFEGNELYIVECWIIMKYTEKYTHFFFFLLYLFNQRNVMRTIVAQLEAVALNFIMSYVRSLHSATMRMIQQCGGAIVDVYVVCLCVCDIIIFYIFNFSIIIIIIDWSELHAQVPLCKQTPRSYIRHVVTLKCINLLWNRKIKIK